VQKLEQAKAGRAKINEAIEIYNAGVDEAQLAVAAFEAAENIAKRGEKGITKYSAKLIKEAAEKYDEVAAAKTRKGRAAYVKQKIVDDQQMKAGRIRDRKVEKSFLGDGNS
jgi:hypothetical protein